MSHHGNDPFIDQAIDDLQPLSKASVVPSDTANSRPTMVEALLTIQSELPKLKKDANNPFFKSKYVPLEQVMEVVLPILNKHKFVLLQQPCVKDGQPALKTTLLYQDGSKIEETMYLIMAKSDPQAQGSAITYARRYSLMSLLGLIGDIDDDGNKATAAVWKTTVSTREKDPDWINDEPSDGKQLTVQNKQVEEFNKKQETKECPVHNEPMFHGVSKSKFKKDGTGVEYWAHDTDAGRCFGREV